MTDKEKINAILNVFKNMPRDEDNDFYMVSSIDLYGGLKNIETIVKLGINSTRNV